MKKFSAALLGILIIMAIFATFTSDTTFASYTSAAANLNNTFIAGNYGGPSLQEQLNGLMRDVLEGGVLEGAHQNFNHKNSWAIRLYDYLNGGGGGNTYGFQNPISGSGLVLMTDSMEVGEGAWNPAVFITSSSEFDHGTISSHPHLSRLFGSMIIVKRQGKKNPITYFVVEADGRLGALNSFYLEDLKDG